MKTLFFASVLFFMQMASAQFSSQEIQRVCSDTNLTVCADLQFTTEISSKIPGEFMIQVITPEAVPLSNFKADLWMSMGNHGHGSAPLKITALENNQFQIKNAHFVMMGTWLIRLNFNLGSEAFHLEFPVDVKQ